MLFGILGPIEAWSTDGTVVPVGGPRLRSLLAILLLEAGRVVSTDRLVDRLYGEDLPAGAANALQSQVSRLRRGLGDAGALVEFHPAGYRLAVDPDDVDAHRFSRLAAEGRHALAAGDTARANRLLDEALGLWRGPVLADVAEMPFAAAQSARWEEFRLAAFEDRTEARLALGEYAGMVADLRDAVAAAPLRERLRGQLMRALYGTGRPAEALAVFDEARRTLADELGTDPSAELTAIQLAVLRAEPTAAAGPAEVSGGARAPARPLPAQLTSFVGRDEELARIGKLLDAGRLVTVTGPGGAGKTRLAIEAGEREGLTSRHRADERGANDRGGVFFVDLAPIGSGGELAQAILAALGLRESGLLQPASGRPDFEGRLVAGLADRDILLILDNCEHVIADAARLSHLLLGACPRLRILATSREPLGVTGESLWPLAPLALPPPGTDADHALLFPAVRLLADRAQAANPSFTVDAGNVGAVVRICTALDGLPLAIELAAARLRSLTVDDVAARLDDRFRLLSRGSRTAAPRHQTLWAVVEWSWELLSPRERVLARRLTVFAGGATLDAAEVVCTGPSLSRRENAPTTGPGIGIELDVADVLAGLADKSLVDVVAGRYRMLDTIRVFCAAQLAEAGETEALSAAHAAYFLELAETADEPLRGTDQLRWLARLSAEQGNLQAALRWAGRSAPHIGLRLVAALSFYWLLRGLRSEVAPLVAVLLDTIGHQPPAGLDEEYAVSVLNVAAGGGHDPALAADLERTETILLTLSRPPRQPFAMVLMAQVLGFRGIEIDRQRMMAGASQWLRALNDVGQGFFGFYTGNVEMAEREFSQALDGFRTLGDRWGMATALDTLASIASWRGDLDRSVAMRDEALGMMNELGALEDMSTLLAGRADSKLRGGDPDGAAEDYARAVELARQAGAAEALAGAYHGQGELARLRGDLPEAMRLYDVASSRNAATWAGGEPRWRLLVAQGRVAEAQANVALARSLHHEAVAFALGTGNNLVLAYATEGLAGVAILEGDGEAAAVLLGLGLVFRGTTIAGDPDIARVAASARDLAGPQTYRLAYARGMSMTREEALEILRVPAASAGAELPPTS